MTAPSTDPTSVTAVVRHLGLSDPSGDEHDRIAAVVAAVTSLLVSWFGDLGADGGVWPAHMGEGATMLAARVWRRRNSPAGVEALGELGPVYVSRNDPDIGQLLGLGRYARPAVG